MSLTGWLILHLINICIVIKIPKNSNQTTMYLDVQHHTDTLCSFSKVRQDETRKCSLEANEHL